MSCGRLTIELEHLMSTDATECQITAELFHWYMLWLNRALPIWILNSSTMTVGKAFRRFCIKMKSKIVYEKLILVFFLVFILFFSINNGSNLEAFYCAIYSVVVDVFSLFIRIYFPFLFITKSVSKVITKQYRNIIYFDCILANNGNIDMEYCLYVWVIFSLLHQYWHEVRCLFVAINM